MANKPTLKTRSAVNYHEAEKWIEGKLGYPLRDVRRSRDHYASWCENHGIVCRPNSKKQFAQYQNAPDGEKLRPEYLDFWHFICDEFNPMNGGTIIISSDLLDGRAQPWQEEIVRAFIAKFGDGCEYWTEW